ncbi:bifunctional homocysteine S-methyltransferase/methylenetetrahydrofolate reductase [uncultured Clostridium sp.]|uniref:bifunctional homocysteine S-methyltransferase/methylenetetrahydrofolate reductase n=1 Tax=uncultured Clostridium sp. TaxID=59620 RepID=UPI0025EDA9BA|nr:bifunctional homocysteine S-methyltransferase/methylenetetrahydrofolate reductase [uncultured Clostridium sp.]
MIKEYLKNNIIICDGAMGTYYSELTGNDASYCEFGNLNDKNTIRRIHDEYIDAGAKLIRTNTFSANTKELGISRKTLKDIIDSGIYIAREAAENKDIFIGASIGPIRENSADENYGEVLDEYKFIADCFLENNIDIFIFETLSNVSYLKEISRYIKGKNPDSFILTQFAVKPDGFTRDGYSTSKIVSEIKKIDSIDSYGLNCGSGPAHLLDLIKNINIENDIVSALPNAGFPEIIHERTVYPNNPSYFAQKVKEIKKHGASIIGGCCGTSPLYIKKIRQIIDNKPENIEKAITYNKENETKTEKVENTFEKKMRKGKFVIAVELSAPVDTDITKIMNGAKICHDNNIDLVTVPDSPMSKVRADSVLISSKIKREIGIEAMPHMCCRDKNTNAIRSSLIGAHIEEIRNVLAITGDPVSDASRVETKSVFNLNSFKLIKLINDMNEEVFENDNIFIGGAINPNVRNKEVEFNRMMKKIENGAEFFLTQPVYDDAAVEFLRKIKEKTDVKILGGILPVVSYRNAVFLNNELPGVTIPKEFINRFTADMTKEEGQAVGVDIAVSMGKKLKDICDGLYFITPFGRTNMIVDIVNKINEA